MAVTDSSAVPQLSKDGSNLWRWENAFKLYAQANAYDQLLKGTWERPIVVVPDLQEEPTQYGTSTIPDQATLTAVIHRIRQDNDHSERKYARDQQEHQRRQAAGAALKLAILNTVPKDLYEGIMEQSVADQFTSVLSRFRDQGVTEKCTVWANFFKLRASQCATTSVFTDQFKAGLAKVDKMECIILIKCKVYQFILAIEDTYPSYARERRSDLRRGVTLSIDHMCNELNDEARRDDPIKSAACNDAGKTRDPNLAWSHSEAYGSARENRNLESIDTYRSCTKGLQKTAYLHLGDYNVKYTKAMKR
jgi:hypothetical protein